LQQPVIDLRMCFVVILVVIMGNSAIPDTCIDQNSPGLGPGLD
jgi:hypothetical protein